MAGIKFNTMTKEIEITGPESFIESNFHEIQDLLTDSLGVQKTNVASKAEAGQKLFVEINESKTSEAIEISQVSEAPEKVSAAKPVIPEVSGEPKAARPPVRKYFNTLGKYIRSEDTSINKSPVVGLIKQIPEGISIASLKEKFGLSEQQIEGIIKDAEKQGKIRRDLDGSYVWV